MILCFDIGGTTIKTAEAFSTADIRPGPRIPTPADDLTAFLAALQKAVATASTRPERLAFSLAGVIDPDTGRATVANIPCISGKVLLPLIEQALGLPVDLANDADCFALAESALGAGRGKEVVFGIILGTGVGGGVVVRGELINRRGGFAGEWGHGPVMPRLLSHPAVTLPDFPCGCGQVNCLDAVCSARGIEKLHRVLHPDSADRPDSLTILSRWQEGEAQAGHTVGIWLALISGPLAMVQNLLGADVIAAGGGLSNSRELIAALDLALRDRILRKYDHPLVVPAECQIEPGLIGSAILGLSRSQSPTA